MCNIYQMAGIQKECQFCPALPFLCQSFYKGLKIHLRSKKRSGIPERALLERNPLKDWLKRTHIHQCHTTFYVRAKSHFSLFSVLVQKDKKVIGQNSVDYRK